ncbi:GNAT family N-acetyltransferase [Bacillus massilinigeriensis]|uniref:GNAT family N-acetyltransferase n=1 Tax=Bacillus massilionigeriensis TaxID=1805475 RepID=UPI000A066AD8|nr:GNAT family protein [Bacillus massilionigeriensis]
MFPELETDRFILRQLQMEDAPQMYRYFSLDEVTKFYDIETHTSEKEAADLIKQLSYRYSNGEQIRWGITFKNSNEIIGTCGLHEIEREHFKAEIGYELHPDYWGKGIMSEVITKVVEYAFSYMGLHRVEAFYHPLNIASKKALEKSGFQYEGLLRKRFFVKGRFMDVEISSIIKEE